MSDYILKPALAEDVRMALTHLRNPVPDRKKGLFVQCFGNFAVFYDGEAVHFRRAKAKELFAYLIDRRGAPATNAELRAVLWEDGAENSDRKRRYFAQIVYELRRTLEGLGCTELFVQSRNSYAIRPENISCDYYLALSQKDIQLSGCYEGEYMSQYSWAEQRLGILNEMQKKKKKE